MIDEVWVRKGIKVEYFRVGEFYSDQQESAPKDVKHHWGNSIFYNCRDKFDCGAKTAKNGVTHDKLSFDLIRSLLADNGMIKAVD